MIKGKNIVVVGIQPWDIEIGSNCKNLASEFALNNRVLYVNSPMDRFSRYKERNTEKIRRRLKIRQGKEPNLVEVEPNLWNLYPDHIIESINWITSPKLFDKLNYLNSRKFSIDIKRAAQALGFKEFILFNDSSMFLGFYLKELLKPSLYIYYMRDYLIKNPYWRRHGERIEPQLISKADLIVNNSSLYTEYGAKYNKHSYMVGQGCDTTLFNDLERDIEIASDLKEIPSPIIGYVGFLSSRRLDIELIKHIALERPLWSIVLVGPEDETFKRSILHEMSNVYFLGSRESSQLPCYIKGFDIAFNPQLINDATMGNYPRKIDEYLTMGKPVLATDTKAMEYFKDYTYLGKSKEEYVQLADNALKDNSGELEKARRMFGTSHTWENNVNQIYHYATVVAKEKGIEI